MISSCVIPAKAGIQSRRRLWTPAFAGVTAAVAFAMSIMAGSAYGAPTAANSSGKGLGEEMEVQIKGQFKGRLLVKNIVAQVTMNLEKLQDFPEDPAQKILLDPLPISQASEFNGRREIKGHAPFWPWIPTVAEPPFLRI